MGGVAKCEIVAVVGKTQTVLEEFVLVIAWGRVKLRINITRVFRNCRNCPSRAATRAISAISENTSDINP